MGPRTWSRSPEVAVGGEREGGIRDPPCEPRGATRGRGGRNPWRVIEGTAALRVMVVAVVVVEGEGEGPTGG